MIRQLLRARHRYGLKKLARKGLKTGKNTILFNEVWDYGCNPHLVEIGSNCIVTAGTKFITNPAVNQWEDEDDDKQRQHCRIIVHNNCFIGMKAVIFPGVTIGPCSIIGAGAVVTCDVLPGTCVLGNPARAACTLDTYIRICEKNLIPEYSPEEKQRILVEHFWNRGN